LTHIDTNYFSQQSNYQNSCEERI